jgi:flavin reductase (DIM6/NTAB) family NADH-FMN oxidoreductase RutF
MGGKVMDLQDWSRYAAEFNRAMDNPGAFLTTQAAGRADTMTIGWGSAGFFWVRPVLTVVVRFSRYTKELLDQSGCFTVSIPKAGELLKELAFCGTKSGRNADKFASCGLTQRPGRAVAVPVIGEAQTHLECEVLYKADMSGIQLDADVDRRFYADHNYHTLYFGEVVDFYGLC